MKITDIARMREIVWQLKTDDERRAANRALINHEFNGGAPYTDNEALENGIFTNVQPLMAPRLAHDARRQLARSTAATGNYFTVKINLNAPSEVVANVSAIVTKAINKALKKDRHLVELLRGIDANVVLHGRGPVLWDDDMDPLPRMLAIEDLKLPTDTYTDFSNLTHFAVYMQLSAAELMEKITRKKNPGWNVPEVKRVVAKLVKDVLETSESDDEFPEKLNEDMKQNGSFYASDRVPTAKCWAFFQRVSDKNDTHWEMCIFEDFTVETSAKSSDFGKVKGGFLFKQKRGFASDVCELLHCQYADGSNVPPFKYHSVRGLGYLLYPVMRLHDRAFCRAMDSFFESMNQLFKNVGEEDREKLQQVVLANFSVLPTGVEYVPAQERYTINHNVVNAYFAMLRQYIQENSASFTQDHDSGTRKEMTATEAMARVQQTTALVGSMLAMQQVYRQFFWTEVARRFCLPRNRTPIVAEFRKEMRAKGIPDEVFDFDIWDVTVEQVVGGGNKTLEIAQTRALMEVRSAYPPNAQTMILREYTRALTDDPVKTLEMLPVERQEPTKTETFATMAIGTLLQGLPVIPDDTINLDQYAGTLTALLGKKTQSLVQTGIAPAIETVIGIQFTAQHIGEIVSQLARDENKRQALGGVVGILREIIQQTAEWVKQIQSQQGQGGLTPEAISKLQSSQILAESKARIDEQRAQQRLAHREAAHKQKMAEGIVRTQADLEAKDLQTAQSLRSQAAQSRLDMAEQAERMKIEAEQSKQEGMETSE